MPAALPSNHWASLREAGASAGLWFLYGVYRLGGRWIYRALLIPVAAYFVLVRGVARRASIDYLQRVGTLAPDASRWTRFAHAVRHVYHFADVLLDKALVWTGALDLSKMQLNSDQCFEAAVRDGRGGVIVVAHIGNLEVLRSFGKRLPGVRLQILVHTRHALRFNRLLTRLNVESSANLRQVTEVDAAVAAELSARVDAGEFVVIAADRVPVSGAGRSLPISFLGAPAPLPVGPWVLAAALRCPVYWLVCFKRDGEYVVDCELLAESVALPRASRDEALRAVMRGFAGRLEAVCRRAPYQWFNFYPFWATQ